MSLKSILSGTSLICALIIPVIAQAGDQLVPRAEVSVKAGSERSMLTTEFWAPLAQKSDRVVYADVRLMGDNDENREGNLGFGYRQIYAPTNSVLGVHGWIDRRRTEYNSRFHQATLGVESLGDKIDLRANGYVPLNNARMVTTPNLGSTTPYLAGNGLFYDTNGFVNETPQYGFDAEAGYRFPVFEQHVDALRVFGGGYHFFRSGTENVTGFRIRTEAQINKLISIGARFQHDGPRGSQGFLEATLRFPFSAKKLYQTDKLHSRLDESPERDIDIVTASKVDNGLRKQIVTTDANGNTIEQRIVYVDNTNTQTGDGTKENPFNNLLSAQNALQANDIIYVFRGDGTTHNMDQGITISQSNVRLIGSGSDLAINGLTFLNAGYAPTITNTQASTDDYTGNGITILADGAFISGLNIDGTTSLGIHAIADGQSWKSVTMQNLSISQTHDYAARVKVVNDGSVEQISFLNNQMLDIQLGANTLNRGFEINVNSNSIVGSALIENNLSNNNGSAYYFSVAGAAIINEIFVSNNASYNSATRGFFLQANGTGSAVNNATFLNNFSSNDMIGFVLNSSSNAPRLNNVILQNNTVIGSTQTGISMRSAQQGILQASLSGNILTDNGTGGSYYGILIDNDSSATFNVDLGGGSLNSAGGNRIYGNAYRDIYIDSRPGTSGSIAGTTISAKYNWWGTPAGLDQANRATFDNGSASPGSSIDASNPLSQ